MICPHCGKEMKKGEVQMGDSVQAKIKRGTVVLWVPDEEKGKFVPKNSVRLKAWGEAFYCPDCEKVIAEFDKREPEFLM